MTNNYIPNGLTSAGVVSTAAIAPGSITVTGGYTGPKISIDDIKGGKSVASKDDVVKALYRLNPALQIEFKDEDAFVGALIAAGDAAYQEQSIKKLDGAGFNWTK